jgi:hypothetical protein
MRVSFRQLRTFRRVGLAKAQRGPPIVEGRRRPPASHGLVSQDAISNMPVLSATYFPSGEAVPVLGQAVCPHSSYRLRFGGSIAIDKRCAS